MTLKGLASVPDGPAGSVGKVQGVLEIKTNQSALIPVICVTDWTARVVTAVNLLFHVQTIQIQLQMSILHLDFYIYIQFEFVFMLLCTQST
jgi:preprotein translocase subunit SecY